MSRWIWCGAVALVAALASVNTLANGFVFDDVDNVLRNPWVREPGRLLDAFTQHAAAFDARFETSFYRPGMHFLYAAAYALAGEQAWAFHLLNLVFHAVATALVFVLLSRWSSGEGERGPRPGPVAGALLFAVHPVHTEPVAWIAGITDLSYASLMVAAFLVVTGDRGRPAARRGVAAVVFFLALLCKEPAIVLLPLVLVAHAARGGLAWPTRRRGVLLDLGALGGAAVAYLALRVAALGGLAGGDRRVAVTFGEGLLTGIALVGEYLTKLVWPTGLTPLHDFGVVSTIASVPFAIGAVALLAVGVVAWFGRREPAVVLGTALVLLPLLPTLYVPALGEGLVAERYLYLPVAGLALVAACAIDAAWARRPIPWLRAAGAAVAALLLAVCGVATFVRNQDWRDSLALWRDTAEKVPASPAAHEYLGFAYLVSGEYGAAEGALSRALALDPARVDARVNLASALVALGRPAEARGHLAVAIERRPRMAEAYVVLGNAFVAEGKLNEALSGYVRAVEANPASALAHFRLAGVQIQLGMRDTGMSHLQEAARLDSRYANYLK